MKLGIKVGPREDSIRDLDATNPAMAEVWFNITKAADYEALFADLRKRHIDVGLHFWGMLPDGTAPNLAYPDQTLINESLRLMRQTIDIAAQNHFQYVNIHPGAATKYSINFNADPSWIVLSEPAEMTHCIELFLNHATTLSTYAADRGVVFAIETVPSRVPRDFSGRNRAHAINIHELPAEAIIQAATLGLFVANDFGHTSSAIITDDTTVIWNYLCDVTKKLASQTRLIHLGFLLPPYNGTDIHDHLDNPLLETNQAIPNTQQIIELLRLFKNRDDLWMLCEPNGQHIKNYFLAQKLVKQAFS